MTKAQELLAFASKYAVKRFRETGELAPMFDIVDSNGEHTIVLVDFDTPEDKDNVSEFIRAKLREFQAVRYAYMTEAWRVDARRGQADEKLLMALTRAGRLADHEDRIEILMVTVEDRDTGEFLQRWYQILRPEHGEPTLSPPRDESWRGGKSSGRFVRMFEP